MTIAEELIRPIVTELAKTFIQDEDFKGVLKITGLLAGAVIELNTHIKRLEAELDEVPGAWRWDGVWEYK